MLGLVCACGCVCVRAQRPPAAQSLPLPHPSCDPSSALRTSRLPNPFLGGPRMASRPRPWQHADQRPDPAPQMPRECGQGSPWSKDLVRAAPGGFGDHPLQFPRGPTWTVPLLPLVQAHGKGDRPWSLTPPVSDQLRAEGFPRPGPRDPSGSGDHSSVRWMATAPQGQGAGC